MKRSRFICSNMSLLNGSRLLSLGAPFSLRSNWLARFPGTFIRPVIFLLGADRGNPLGKGWKAFMLAQIFEIRTQSSD